MAEAVRSRPSSESEETEEIVERTRRGDSLVRWGPSFAGAISTFAIGAMGMALWWAIGYGSNVSFVTTNMAWFFLGTVLAALLVGGGIAGWTAGLRRRAVGFFDGATVWGLTLVGALIPLSVRGLQMAGSGFAHPARATAFQVSSGDTWALFGAIAGGLVCAVVGAVVGSLPKRHAGEPYLYDRRGRPTGEVQRVPRAS